MTHFGLICPSSTGHLHTMLPLGQELKRRGHRVTLFGILDAQPKTLAAGLEFQPMGESDFPQGATKELFTQLGKLSGFKALQYTIKWIADQAELYLRDAPEAIRRAGIEALLVDQASSAGAGSVIALLLWVCYSAQIFFFGAEFTRQFAMRFGSLRPRDQLTSISP